MLLCVVLSCLACQLDSKPLLSACWDFGPLTRWWGVEPAEQHVHIQLHASLASGCFAIVPLHLKVACMVWQVHACNVHNQRLVLSDRHLVFGLVLGCCRVLLLLLLVAGKREQGQRGWHAQWRGCWCCCAACCSLGGFDLLALWSCHCQGKGGISAVPGKRKIQQQGQCMIAAGCAHTKVCLQRGMRTAAGYA